MADRYRIICPWCQTEFPAEEGDTGENRCPACGKRPNDDYEVLFRPSQSRMWPRWIALAILLAFATVLLLALVALYP